MNLWLLKRCLNKRVLDYCCGNALTSIFLANNGAEVVGIDMSNVSIENARKEAKRQGVDEKTAFFVMDGEALEFDDDYFDVIYESGVLHHLDIQKAYRELTRVLKPNGEIICIEALGHNPVIHLYRKMSPHLRTKWEVEHILCKKDLEMTKRYFAKVETKFFHLATLAAVPFRNLPGFSILLKLLEAVDSVLLKLPFLKWQAWQVVFVLSQPNKSLFISSV